MANHQVLLKPEISRKVDITEAVEIITPDEKILNDVAEKLVAHIISDCLTYVTLNPDEDLEECVLNRIVGLHYISDLGNFLPDWHPAKGYIPDLYKIAELTANKAAKTIKDVKLLERVKP